MSDYNSKIITFYSYKGGVGRSMALANVAWLLANKYGHKVLLVDWDLEAPGLHKFFNIKENEIKTGLIDLFYDYKTLLKEDHPITNDEFIDLDQYIMKLPCNFDKGSLSILPAGKTDDGNYANQVNNFEWDDFYKNWHGFGFIEYLKDKLKSKADFVLIDSRTGITDIGGICTLQMPDVVVLLFSLNEQCISGTEMIAEKILTKSSDVVEQQNPPKIILIPSRIDKNLEIDTKHEWELKSARRLKKYIELPEDKSLDYIKENSIPYVGFYSFGEILAVKKEPKEEPAKSLENLTRMIRMASGCEEDALEVFEKAIEIKPDDFSAWYNKGNTLVNLGRYEDALEAFEKATEIKPDNLRAWINKGNTLDDLGRNEDALEVFEKAIEIKPDDFRVLNNKGTALANLGRYEDALEAFEKAIEIKPDTYTWYNQGNTLGHLGRYEDALEAFEKAIEIKPDNFHAWINKGNTLGNLKRYEDALEAFEKAIEIKPDDFSAWYNKGNTFDDLVRYEDALEAFEKATEIKPDNFHAWYNKGITLDDLGRYEDALEVYEKAIEIKPDAKAWYNKGTALGNLGRYEDALEAFEKAIEIKPDDLRALNNKGTTLDNLGRYEDALEAFEKAIEIKPDDFSALNNKGTTLSNLGRYEDALEVYEKAIEIKPDYDSLWYNRACAFSLTNKKEDSLYNLKRAIEFDSSYKRQAKKDTDFEKLWDDSDFIKIVE
ncbi:MAG: tetratricopeptide repeat protein [ANME-2 cluster archaeon]|nr:tetratricopeptide repeat protein [ANME-2 cluster archaeon]MBC2700910.1 tetratricopeptide repeat protein [ANME-2 cluster archaeon]MBC2709253.1 tetratricopeptide repeat protein [ANME-2 cluster archaeon]MBC2745436.1 tetratricopeptide repeat protein [ANME-2 cluster archaeon]